MRTIIDDKQFISTNTVFTTPNKTYQLFNITNIQFWNLLYIFVHQDNARTRPDHIQVLRRFHIKV